MPIIVLVCVLTFLHYVGAQMRGPVLPLYAVAHGATATGVGVIVAAHMGVSAFASVPLGRASDVWGRRALVLVGMSVSAVTSLLLPLAEASFGLTIIYAVAGLGVAAFTPSVLAIVGDAAAPGFVGRAYAWYATAHYGAIGVGAFLGGVTAQATGHRASFVISAGVIGIALTLGLVATWRPERRQATSAPTGTFADVRGNRTVWAGWVVAGCGMVTQGVVFTFFPLLADARGLTPSRIGLAFLILGVANTVARIPAGWLVDRTKHSCLYAIGGILIASIATALVPHAGDRVSLLAVMAVFGAVSGTAGVAIGVALAQATVPATRGFVMGGYSTCLYLGLGLGSFAFGPVITRYGYSAGFTFGAVAGAIGALAAGLLWATHGRRARPSSHCTVTLDK
jgi:predicted MFS family arabinose efflux permease